VVRENKETKLPRWTYCNTWKEERNHNKSYPKVQRSKTCLCVL